MQFKTGYIYLAWITETGTVLAEVKLVKQKFHRKENTMDKRINLKEFIKACERSIRKQEKEGV